MPGDGLTLSRILAPMESLRDQMVVATGLSNVAAESKQVGSGVHARAAAAFLSGMPAKRTEGGDIELGKTLDQYAAEELGKETHCCRSSSRSSPAWRATATRATAAST